MQFNNFKGFALTKEDSSVEARAIFYVKTLIQNFDIIRVNINDKCPEDYVPSGGVEWCLKSLGKKVIPNYFPDFLRDHLYRNVWKTDKWPLGKKVFIKPAEHYKKFTGFITTGTYSKKKKGPFWCSDVVKFVNEWRYYVTNGKIVCGEWYWGDHENTPPAPEFTINIPESFSGTLDFGMTNKNDFALIEAHHPFACGWYGKQHELYVQWLIDGWKYMVNRL